MTKFFGFLTLAAVAAAFAPQAAMADQPLMCSMGNPIMNGTYLASGTGVVAGVGPIATVSLVIYNGDGTGMAVSGTRTVNGVSNSTGSAPASFTVNPDCTGSKIIGSTHFSFVITPDGSTITWIVTDNGVTLMGTGVRLKR